LSILCKRRALFLQQMLMIYAPRYIIPVILITNLKLPKRLKCKHFKEVIWLNGNKNRKHQTCFQNIKCSVLPTTYRYKSQMNKLFTDFSLKMHCSVTLIANHTLITFKFVRIRESPGGRDESRNLQCASPRVFSAMCLIKV
jgi:hypothetical protein